MSFESWQQENKQTAPGPIVAPTATSGFEAWQAQNTQTTAFPNILAQQQQEYPVIVGQALEATQRPGSRLAGMPVPPPGYQPDPDSQEPLVAPDPTKAFMDRIEFIYKDPQLNLENKKSLIEEQITKRRRERAGEIIGGVQGQFGQEKLQEELGGKFGKKALRRFQRGGVNVAGGLVDFAGQITKLVTLGKYGDGPADWARLAHDALKAPEFRALEENTFDKFFGAALETAPFMLTAASGAILSGGAAIPSFVTSFVVSYAVEGNGAYQTALDRGLSEREARLRGVVVGLVNAGIEVGIGGGAKYFKADVAAATMLSKLRRAGKFTKRFVKNALSEGLEEGLQEISSVVLGGDIPTDKDGNIDFNAAAGRIVDAWIAGTILGGAFEGLQISKQAVKKYAGQKGIQKKGAVRKTKATQQDIITKYSGLLPDMLPSGMPHPGIMLREDLGGLEGRTHRGGAIDIAKFTGHPELFERTVAHEVAHEIFPHIMNKYSGAVRIHRNIDTGKTRIEIKEDADPKLRAAAELVKSFHDKPVTKYLKDRKGDTDGWADTEFGGEALAEAWAILQVGGRIEATARRVNPKGMALADKVFADEVTAPVPSPAQKMPPLIVQDPTTADQAIGQQYGLTNEQTDDKLANAEQRFRELKYANTEKMTNTEKQELAFLSRNRNNVEALLDRETQPTAPKIQKRNKKTLLAVAHKIQREANVSDADYRSLAKNVTGKSSMKDMNNKQRTEFVAALEDAYGKPTELSKEDFETPVMVAGRETTMGAIGRDAAIAVDNLEVKKETPALVKVGFGKTGPIGRLKSFFFGIDNTPVYHLARILDGGTDGIFTEVLDKNIQAGQKVSRAHMRSVFNALNQKLAEAGVTDKNLAKMSRALNPRLQTHQWLRKGASTEIQIESINGKDYEMSTANLIDIYLMSNQKKGMLHLLNGGLVVNTVETGKLSEEWITDLRNRIESDPRTVAVIDAIMSVGEEQWKPALNEVSNRLEGNDIATESNWWGFEVYNPKHLVGKQRPGLARSHDINLMEDKSILNPRTNGKGPLVVRDAFNRFSVFESAIAEYVGMAEPTRTSRTLLNDTDIAAILVKKGYGRVRDNIVEIHKQAQSVPASEGSFTAFFAHHLPGLYRAVLFFNPRVVASQFTSVTNYGAYASPQFMGSMKDGLSIANAQETLELSDFAWERFNMGHSSLELGEMAKSDAALRLWADKSSDINKLGWTLKVADLGALTAGMSVAQQEYTAAQKGELEGLSAEWWLDKDNLPEADVEMWRRVKEMGEEADPQEVEAVEAWKQVVTERAEYLWQRTQPSWDKWNRSVITTQRGARRLFLLFRSFHEKSLTIFNEAKLDYEKSSKTLEDKGRFIQRTGSVMAGYTLNMALRLAILAAMTRKAKEPLQYLQDFLTSWMAMFPIFGKVLDAGSRQFIAKATGTTAQYRGEPLGSFPIKMVNIALKAPTDFAGAAGSFVAGDNEAAIEDLEKGIKKIYEGVGALYGIPVYEIGRVLPDSDDEPATGRGKRSGQRRTSQSRSRRSGS